jgi:hypothetical protein
MAKCKVCKKNIPDGTDYCEDCQDQGVVKTKESYLDSLLSSVKNGPSMEDIYKRKNHSDGGDNSPGSMAHQNPEPAENLVSAKDLGWEHIQVPYIDDDELYKVGFSDIDEFDSLSYENDLQDLEPEIFISDEDLFGENLSDLFSQGKPEDKPLTAVPEEVHAAQVNYVNAPMDLPVSDMQEEPVGLEMDTELADISSDRQLQSLEETKEVNENLDSEIDMDLDYLLNRLHAQNIESPEEEKHEPQQEESSQYIGDDINEMMFSLEDDSKNGEDMTEQQKAGQLQDVRQEEQQEEEQDDFLSLLNQMSEEDPVLEDVRAIHDLLGNASSNLRNEDSMPSDVGEVFSDALRVVSSLNDYELEEDSILGGSQDKASPNGKKGKNSKKPVKEKKPGKEKAKKAKKTKAAKAKSGLSLFQRIFGNVKNEKTAAEHEKELLATSEPQAKSPKKSKLRVKKGAVSEDGENTDLEDNNEGKGKPSKKERKKEKAEKKLKSKDVIQVIDEIDEDPGRINRVGAAVVLFFFAIIAMIVILGTNVITYTLSIEYATSYFNNRKYTQAYNEVYGVEIKDEDIEIYDKIMTVMFVNKQLNSYNNYYDMKKYPEALDSLLKGLSRYDKYIELAAMLGIESDLDYVRSQILAELYNVFNLTEQEAAQILQNDNMEDYSLAVYDVVLEKMNN